ncbi:hypothetical protein [Rhizobium sp. Rhizsp82]|uniref:hypothetical protein n=1 Tax=Rhizobium sp. Rhizsp82 TaxID=3243057 RepID=UPI0039B5C75A
MTTASARVVQTIPTTKTAHATESMLEADALLVLVARSMRKGRSPVVRVQTQVLVKYTIGSVNKKHWFDLVLTYADGRTGYYAIKKEGDGHLVEHEIELIDNQVFATSRCFARYVTSDMLPKPQVNLAREFMRSLEVSNSVLNNAIVTKLKANGGRATVHTLLTDLTAGYTYADGWTAIHQLMGTGLINHDHPSGGAASIAARSWVSFAKGQKHDTARAA